MPLPLLTETLGAKRAAHLLHRATFGPTLQEIDNFATLTPALAIQKLFQQPLPDPVLPLDVKTNKEWFLTGTTDANSGDSELQEFFKGWFLHQMLSANVNANVALAYSVREKAVFFLHTLFTAIQSKIDSSRALYFQNQLYRQFVFDKFAIAAVNVKELTKKVSVDNAMLRLLDGNLNVNGSPNENYARELLELYSIGRGLEGTLPAITDPGDYFVFREQDVQAAARVLSGWDFDSTFSNIDPDTLLPRGKVKGSTTNAAQHDNGIKTFSDRFDNATIQPDTTLITGTTPTEASALKEISDLVDMIYARPETARNICRRIYRFYVYHNITQQVDDTIIAGMAETFKNAGFKLQPVLEELFMSQHFYEAAPGNTDDQFGAIIRSPLDLLMGSYRFFGVKLPDPTTATKDFYEKTDMMVDLLSGMGMNFYEPFDVAGYDAYHQYPIYHRSWISTNYLTRRYEFIRGLVSPMQMMPGDLAVDVVEFVRNNIPQGIASNPRDLIIALARYLLPLSDNLTFDAAADDNAGLTAERLNYFLTAFLKSPEIDANPEAAWTFRWNNPVDPEVVRNQLQSLFNAMMQSPEYQLY